jgi:anti-sigma-K factor RskA
MYNQNIWEVAETYMSGALSESEKQDLKIRLETDINFANEFYESIELINSIEGSGKQRRFREMLRDIHQKQSVPAAPRQKAKLIWLRPQSWRTAGVAAGVAILTSTITFWSLKPSI